MKNTEDLVRNKLIHWVNRTSAENNVYRILIQMLPVVIAKNSRRTVQLPRGMALGLPRPWDQQWSLRLQQIMAFETDLLEFEDVLEDQPL